MGKLWAHCYAPKWDENDINLNLHAFPYIRIGNNAPLALRRRGAGVRFNDFTFQEDGLLWSRTFS
ncbi:MAG TPA: hypothetical protein PLX22_13345, partial [Spirochaetota bacterium]|nr:hypothetical protein [Spirochaetota bacterium]